MKHNAKWAEETVKIKVEYGEFSEAEVILRCRPGGHSVRCSESGESSDPGGFRSGNHSGIQLVFGWFEGFPLWCAPVFWGLMAAGFAFMILEYYFELHQETAVLNQKPE